MSRSSNTSSAGLRYVLGGTGEPALVFVHDVFGAHDDWRLQLDRFEDEYTVVALDPGDGSLPPPSAQSAASETEG